VTEIVGWRGLLGLTDGQIATIRRAFDYAALDGDDDEEALDLAVAVYLSFRPVTFSQPELEVKLLLACTARPACPVPIPVFRELNCE
jgi:hypothetical protein